MGAARLGGAGDQTVGEWEGPSGPGRAGRGEGKHRGFRPPTRDARSARLHHSFRGRGSRTPAEGSAARSQPGGNRTRGLSPQATPLSRQAEARLSARLPALPGSWGRGQPPAVTQRTGPRGCARALKGRGLACGPRGRTEALQRPVAYFRDNITDCRLGHNSLVLINADS